jgi:hypothetical protein
MDLVVVEDTWVLLIGALVGGLGIAVGIAVAVSSRPPEELRSRVVL